MSMENKATESRAGITRVIYILFVLFGLYHVFFMQNYMDAAASLGIGLAFDPFDAQKTWNERPMWQKVWLTVHLAVVALLFGYGIGLNDK